MKKSIKYLLVTVVGIFLAACGSSESADTATIRAAISPGPYSDLFLEDVAPILEDQGYTVEAIEFTDLRAANVGLQEGSADINVDQHLLYMENFNEEAGADLTSISPIPTVPTALFPANKTSLEEAESGDQVAIPDDPSNLTRALLLLEKAEWIELDPEVEPIDITEDDIVNNPSGIEILPMQTASIPRTLPDLDYAVIPGSYVHDAGIEGNSALLTEDLLPELILQAVVKSEDADSDWAQAVVEAYRSDEVAQAVQELNDDPAQPIWVLPE